MRTHYNNLKVAENAPDEVIRAAYRALSQTYHPDKNPGNPDAVKIMQILNDAYTVLSNPAARQKYDSYLAEARKPRPSPTQAAQRPVPAAPVPVPEARVEKPLWLRILHMDARKGVFLLMVVPFIGLCWQDYQEAERKKKEPVKPYQPYTPTVGSALFPQERPVYVRPFQRPAAAPNGRAWPSGAAYISGYPMLAGGGLSSVTVDNSKNNSDVFVKLVSLDAATDAPVRFCYIPAFAEFTMSGVKPGRYDVRYRDLSTGGLSKTDEFTLKETKTYDGTRYDQLSLTIYKVANGNMKTESIQESEF